MIRQVLQILLVGLCLQDCFACRPGWPHSIDAANVILDGSGQNRRYVPQLCQEEGIVVNDNFRHRIGKEVLENLTNTIEYLQDLVDSGCSDILGRFLCIIHMPRVHPYRVDGEWNYLRQQPCREVCRDIWRKCRVRTHQLGLKRIPELDCKPFPRGQEGWECLSYLYPPRDAPNVTNVTRHSPRRVSIFLSAPDPESFTQAYFIRFRETWSSIPKVYVFDISVSQDSTANQEITVNTLTNTCNYTFEITAANAFGVGPRVNYHIPEFDDLDSWSCQSISVAVCPNVTNAVLPDSPSLANQELADAVASIERHLWLRELGCHGNLQSMLCAMYFGECSADGKSVQLPYRETCEEIQASCFEFLQEFGYPWPQDLNCQQFPTKFPLTKYYPW